MILTESQVIALEEAKQEKKAHGEIETHHPGFLFGQDTFYVGFIKGVGKIYQQTGIDTFSNFGFAKVYLEKTALTAADFLNDKVLPFFDEEHMKVLRVLTDNGKEYCGPENSHYYSLFLHLNDIQHSKTKVRSPQTNGCTEKLNQTIYNEFYKVAFRKKLYKSLDELQKDLDKYMKEYNYERTNQGKRCKGKTPYETLSAAYELYSRYVIDNAGSYPQLNEESKGVSTNCETICENETNLKASEKTTDSLEERLTEMSAFTNFQNQSKGVTSAENIG